jgi:DNA-binding beta-propeller fold protein YncE
MVKIGRQALVLVCLAIGLLLAGFTPPVVDATSGSWKIVVSGLDNPRGLNFGPHGRLYIAEAGRGGDGACGPGPEGTRCYGASGAVTRWHPRTGNVERVATGLPSLATESEGAFATGPHDIDIDPFGFAFVTIGFGGDPRTRETAFGPDGRKFARELLLLPRNNALVVKDLGNFEIANNPTGDEIDSNPYGMLARLGRQVMTDAGANDLLQVKFGRTSTLATFPNRLVDAPPFLGLPPGTQIPMDAVPTTVAVGPRGDYFVGQLTGFPFPVGGANVYRVPAEGGTPTVYASGFTNIIDIAFGKDGTLYVLQITKNGLLSAFGPPFDWTGALIKVRRNGTRVELAEGALTAPGGIAVGPDGALYVTNNSIYPGIGEVLRIQP